MDSSPVANDLNSRSAGQFPGHIGVVVRTADADAGVLVAEMAIEAHHLAPNGFLHGGAVAALADTACGYGCAISLPADAVGFTTLELKTNFVGTVTEGVLVCTANRLHHGKTTEVWDAVVVGDDNRVIALFRCTQMILRTLPTSARVTALATRGAPPTPVS